MKKQLIAVEQDVEIADFTGQRSATDKFDCSQMSIYIICCKTGKIEISSSFIPHPVMLSNGEVIFLAHPGSEWQMNINSREKSHYYTMRLTLEKLHKLISASFHQIDVARKEDISYRDLMKVLPVSPSTVNIFDQMLSNHMAPPFKKLFVQAKFLELFSLIMNASFGKPLDTCPVLINREIEKKLQKARRLVIEKIHESPDPDALAIELEIPRNTLKEGFKFIYGKSIYQFHSDYKMEAAMSMLKSGTKLVKEIAYEVGYQNPSHFIAAFKKKYGRTPKQYLKAQ